MGARALRFDMQRLLARLPLEAECLPPLSAEERSTLAGLETIVMPIGPYRNLTTLLAAAFALHPQALMLNHAADRLWLKPGVDLIKRPRPEVRAAFLRAAVRLAQGGRRGGYGGSISRRTPSRTRWCGRDTGPAMASAS
jgi:hypothetical protein